MNKKEKIDNSISWKEQKITYKKKVNAQEWLDKNYPKEGICSAEHEKNLKVGNLGKKRNEIELLLIVNLGLEGPLKLEGFTNIEYFSCWGNPLTSLDLSDCKKLRDINILGTDITGDLATFPETLKWVRYFGHDSDLSEKEIEKKKELDKKKYKVFRIEKQLEEINEKNKEK